MRCEPLAERASVHPNASARAHASENRSPAGLALALFRRSSLLIGATGRRRAAYLNGTTTGTTGQQVWRRAWTGFRALHMVRDGRRRPTINRFPGVPQPLVTRYDTSARACSGLRLYRRATISDAGASPALSMSMSRSYEKMLSAARHWADGSCSSSRSQQGSGKDPRCRPTTPTPS